MLPFKIGSSTWHTISYTAYNIHRYPTTIKTNFGFFSLDSAKFKNSIMPAFTAKQSSPIDENLFRKFLSSSAKSIFY